MELLEASHDFLDLVLLRQDGGAQVEGALLLPKASPCTASKELYFRGNHNFKGVLRALPPHNKVPHTFPCYTRWIPARQAMQEREDAICDSDLYCQSLLHSIPRMFVNSALYCTPYAGDFGEYGPPKEAIQV